MAATPPIVKRYLIAFGQYNWLAFLLFVFATLVAGVVALRPDPEPPNPTYRAVGQLSYSTPPPTFTTTGSQLQQQGRAISRRALLSVAVVESVKERLNLTTEQILEIRDKKLKITLPGDNQEEEEEDAKEEAQPQVITLEYSDSLSEERARAVVRTFMEEMVEYSRWLNTSQLRARIEALSKRLSQVQSDLTAAEERFYRYISSEEGSDLIAVQDGSLFSGITSSEQRQREIQLSLQAIEGQISSLSGQLGLNADEAYTSAALSADPIIANLRAQILQNELQLARLELDLRPEHPSIVKLYKDQEVNNILLQQRAQELIGSDGILTPLPDRIRKDSNLDPARQQLANQLVALQTQREGLSKQLISLAKTEQELRQQYEQFPDKQLQQARLVQAVEFQRVIYQNILNALVDAQSAEAETVGSITFSQEPQSETVQPRAQVINRLLIIAAGAGIGLVLGAGSILLLALIDDRLHTPQELRDTVLDKEVPVLGQLPLISMGDSEATERPILLDAESPYLPYYERFRSNIRRLASEACKVILVTSISSEEGKTVTAYNLAIASAQAGKRTLLVEADLRSPSAAGVLQITPDPDAAIEPLRYYANRSEAINLVPAIENLYVLPSPGPQRQAAAIIESSELQLLLKDARGRFDMVIVDTPSLSRCNDALLLEPLTDGLILVTRPGITRSSLLNEAIDQFTEAEVSVLGAVINGVEGLTPTAATPTETPESPEKAEESRGEV